MIFHGFLMLMQVALIFVCNFLYHFLVVSFILELLRFLKAVEGNRI